MAGWWFGTCFIFPYIGNNHPNWLSYFSEGQVYHQPENIHRVAPNVPDGGEIGQINLPTNFTTLLESFIIHNVGATLIKIPLNSPKTYGNPLKFHENQFNPTETH